MQFVRLLTGHPYPPLIKKAKHDLVILGTGDITKALKISAHRFTKTAKDKIEKAGGAATIIEKAQAATE